MGQSCLGFALLLTVLIFPAAVHGAQEQMTMPTSSIDKITAPFAQNARGFETSSLFRGWLPPNAEESLPSTSKPALGMSGTIDENAVAFARWISKGKKRMGNMGAEPAGIKQYFREKDLTVGTQLVLPGFLYQPTSHDQDSGAELKPSFLPASIALYLPPLDIHHLNDLLQLFHIPLDSNMAHKMKETVKACTDAAQGSGKDDNFITSSCATSMEAMLKFVTSILRASTDKIQALTNTKVVGSAGGRVMIVQTEELAPGHDAVDCHELTFPFKVMGCHRIKQSKSMVVRVQQEADDEGKEKMELLVACHKNTTLFDPQHIAFSQLRSSPGRTEICHFLPNSDIMWIPL